MNPSEIIAGASEEGAVLAISSSGSISAKGYHSVIDPWLPAIEKSRLRSLPSCTLSVGAPRCWQCFATILHPLRHRGGGCDY